MIRCRLPVDGVRRYLEQAKNELAKDDAEDNDAECAICYEPFAGNKRVTVCGHEFCAEVCSCRDHSVRI